MRLIILFLLFFNLSLPGVGQTLPPERIVNWHLSGLKDTTTLGFQVIDMQNFGVVGDGMTPNDSVMSAVMESVHGSGAILEFPRGNFLFNTTLFIPSNTIIRGQGAENTSLTMNLGGSGHGIQIQGSSVTTCTASLAQSAVRDSNYIIVSDIAQFSQGDWIQILQEDSVLVSSSWARHSVGQIVSIEAIVDHKIVLASPLRMEYDMARSPCIQKIVPVQNVGIECIKLKREDDTYPQQSSNIYFQYAVNCWVRGIESQRCNFSHIEGRFSSNLHISGSHIHHAFGYGEGGRAYGVILHFTTNECLIEDNIFEHLRHSMILQAGANGNVFSYNYSFDPFWETIQSDLAGDMVLHGNHPYCNLFEQNIGQNIVIDNSHGANGPNNTFFRNRAALYGIFFYDDNSPNQNLVGNEIPNSDLPYSLFNYTIQGTGHFIHGNNNKGTIDAPGTEELPDESYAYDHRPDFIPTGQWAAIGTPNMMGSATIPAFDRYSSGNIFGGLCDDLYRGFEYDVEAKGELVIFPNPVTSELTVESSHFIENLTVIDATGRVQISLKNMGYIFQIDVREWESGMYFVSGSLRDKYTKVKSIIKIDSFHVP